MLAQLAERQRALLRERDLIEHRVREPTSRLVVVLEHRLELAPQRPRLAVEIGHGLDQRALEIAVEDRLAASDEMAHRAVDPARDVIAAVGQRTRERGTIAGGDALAEQQRADQTAAGLGRHRLESHARALEQLARERSHARERAIEVGVADHQHPHARVATAERSQGVRERLQVRRAGRALEKLVEVVQRQHQPDPTIVELRLDRGTQHRRRIALELVRRDAALVVEHRSDRGLQRLACVGVV
jgi:hypothetical protein